MLPIPIPHARELTRAQCRIYFEYMATTVHIPKPLLAAVDRRARLLKMSRNRFVVRTLEKELEHHADWTPGFFDFFRQRGPRNEATLVRMLTDIRKRRRSKGPPEL